MNDLLTKVQERLATGKKLTRELKQSLFEAGLKHCYKCSTTKELSAFGPSKRTSDGVVTECRECVRQRQNAHYHSNTSAYSQRRKDSYLSIAKPVSPFVWKHCPGCEQRLPRICFTNRQDGFSGLEDNCKDCRSEIYKRRYLAHKLQHQEWRARQEGVPCEPFTVEELEDNLKAHGLNLMTCAYTGKALDFDTHSFEHIIPMNHPDTPGHVIGNVVSALRTANYKKNNRSVLPFRIVASVHQATAA